VEFAAAVVISGVAVKLAFTMFTTWATLTTPARFVAVELVALATLRLIADERMPELMEGRMILACAKTFVRLARTGKSMRMSHSGHSRECLKMCLKIYI
jgi:hypothetical protein